MKRFLVFVICIFILDDSFCQSELNGALGELRKTPVAPSPNAAALGKFGEIPVNTSTGIPNISIPIYSFADKGNYLSLNVGLSYHAGGHKVEDLASHVGLGWSLNAGGMISRTMRGRPDDDLQGGYINTPALPFQNTTSFDMYFSRPNQHLPISEGVNARNSPDFHAVRQVGENVLDGQCDIFHFNINGLSGRFFFKKTREVQLITQSNVKIEPNFTYIPNTGSVRIDGFTLIDGLGTKYVFSEREVTEAVGSNGSQINSIGQFVSCWQVTKIISYDGLNEIRFNYGLGVSFMYEGGFSESFQSEFSHTNSGLVKTNSTSTFSFNYIHVGSTRLTSIDLPNKIKIQFGYEHDRQDLTNDKALTDVKIIGPTAEKQFRLSYDYFVTPPCMQGNPCSNPLLYSPNNYFKRLKLLSVQQSDGVNMLPPYTFEYNSTPLPIRNSKAQDWWGFFNGQEGNTTLAGQIPVPGVPGGYVLGGSDRTSNEAATKAWVIEKVHYPTGGHTRFYFELNEGFKATTYRPIGGLRVSKTEDFDPVTGQYNITNYTYKKDDNTSSGTLQHLPNFTYYWTAFYHSPKEVEGFLIMPYYTYFCNETMQPTQSLSYFSGSPVLYTRVKVDKNINGQSNGYSIFEYTPFTGQGYADDTYPFLQRQDLEWAQGLLKKESHYRSDDVLVRSVENEYDILGTMPLNNNTDSRNLISSLVHWDDANTQFELIYAAKAFYMASGRSQLKKATEKVLAQPGVYSEHTVEHFYDNTYFVKTKVRTKNSKGNDVETRMYYPFHYSNVGLPTKPSLMTTNRVAEPIAKEIWEIRAGNSFLKSVAINQPNDVGNGVVRQNRTLSLESNSPIHIQVDNFNPDQLVSHSAIKEKSLITKFDSRGRISELKSPANDYTTMFWGSDNNLPIAVTSNASLEQAAYSSFEYADLGGWIISSGTTNNFGLIGKKSWNGSLTRSVPSGNYKVSAWAQGAVTVNGQTGTSKRQSGTWTYFEWNILNSSTFVVNGSAIDDLRLLPFNATMVSSEVDPLLGLLAEVSDNGDLIFYEYDGFGRLYLVKDGKGNILKKHCYNYQGQIENCSGITNTPQWISDGSSRCKPCGIDPSFYSNVQQIQQRDVNPLSPTYNSYRWIDNGTSATCIAHPAWQVISTVCELSNGQNTGMVTIIRKDMNPCSPSYGQTTTSTEQNIAVCPSAGCNMNNCSGPDKRCVDGNCQTAYKIYTASVYNPSTGMYDCTYHYEWSDGFWSIDYIESSAIECPIF